MSSCVQTGTFRFDSLCVMATVSYFPSQCCFHCQVVEDVKVKQISSNGVQNGVSWELVIDLSISLHFSTEIFFRLRLVAIFKYPDNTQERGNKPKKVTLSLKNVANDR